MHAHMPSLDPDVGDKSLATPATVVHFGTSDQHLFLCAFTDLAVIHGQWVLSGFMEYLNSSLWETDLSSICVSWMSCLVLSETNVGEETVGFGCRYIMLSGSCQWRDVFGVRLGVGIHIPSATVGKKGRSSWYWKAGDLRSARKVWGGTKAKHSKIVRRKPFQFQDFQFSLCF